MGEDGEGMRLGMAIEMKYELVILNPRRESEKKDPYPISLEMERRLGGSLFGCLFKEGINGHLIMKYDA